MPLKAVLMELYLQPQKEWHSGLPQQQGCLIHSSRSQPSFSFLSSCYHLHFQYTTKEKDIKYFTAEKIHIFPPPLLFQDTFGQDTAAHPVAAQPPAREGAMNWEDFLNNLWISDTDWAVGWATPTMAALLAGVTSDSKSALSMSRLYCRYSHEQHVKLFVRSIKKDYIPLLNYLTFIAG